MQRAERGRLGEDARPGCRVELGVGALQRQRVRAIGAAERAAVGQLDEQADRRGGRAQSCVQHPFGLEVAEHGDDVLLDHGRRRVVAGGQFGDDFGQIALAVAELQHRRGGFVDLEDPLRREQRPALRGPRRGGA